MSKPKDELKASDAPVVNAETEKKDAEEAQAKTSNGTFEGFYIDASGNKVKPDGTPFGK